MIQECQKIDIIGDIHGHNALLEQLRQRLGYSRDGDGWRHGERLVVFVGDFIGRGPQQLETLATVRAMVEDGNALGIMGNHEFNALAYFMKDEEGRPLSDNPAEPHLRYLRAVGDGNGLHAYWSEWFLRLPLWLELDGLSIVHACLDDKAMPILQENGLTAENCLVPELVRKASQRGTAAHAALEAVCKGPETPLPEGYFFTDKDGKKRTQIRTRWWNGDAATYRGLALISDDKLPEIPDIPLRDSLRPLSPPQQPLAPRTACTAREGKLAPRARQKLFPPRIQKNFQASELFSQCARRFLFFYQHPYRHFS